MRVQCAHLTRLVPRTRGAPQDGEAISAMLNADANGGAINTCTAAVNVGAIKLSTKFCKFDSNSASFVRCAARPATEHPVLFR